MITIITGIILSQMSSSHQKDLPCPFKKILLSVLCTSAVLSTEGKPSSFTMLIIISSFYRILKKWKTFSVFPYSYRNTSGSLGEREIEVGTRTRGASLSRLFRVLPNLHERFYDVSEHRKKCFLFLL